MKNEKAPPNGRALLSMTVDGSANFFVHCMALQEGIVLLELNALGGVLLVLHRGVTGCRLAFFFGFRTLERDDDACALLGHDSLRQLLF